MRWGKRNQRAGTSGSHELIADADSTTSGSGEQGAPSGKRTTNVPTIEPVGLEVAGVSVELGGRPIVRDVSFHVKPGQFFGLLGPNGSGKSTLLRSIYGLRKPSAGQVRIAGQPSAEMRPRQLALQVAVMAQENASADFAMNVDEVVMLGRAPHQSGFGADSPRDREIVEQALADVDALSLRNRTFHTLSGGEKQRVLLARAFAQETPVIILDEPTNHLDIGYQIDLLECVARRGVTVLAALHDMNLASDFCDVLAVMRGGELVTHGPSDEVLTSDVLADAFRVNTHHLIHPATGRPLVAISRKGNA